MRYRSIALLHVTYIFDNDIATRVCRRYCLPLFEVITRGTIWPPAGRMKNLETDVNPGPYSAEIGCQFFEVWPNFRLRSIGEKRAG